MLEIERKENPDKVAELFEAKVIPSLFTAANDENAQVSDQARKLITEITKEANPAVSNTIRETLILTLHRNGMHPTPHHEVSHAA